MAREKQRETAFLAVTDVHFGKKTQSYDPETTLARMAAIPQRVASIMDHLRSSYDIDKLVVGLLGDGPDGSDIYPTQAHHQAISNAEEQCNLYADEVLVPLIAGLRQSFKKVEVACVAGNHGRTGKGAHEAANWDITAYRYASLALSRTRGVHFPVEPVVPLVRTLHIRGHRILLYHGHGIRGYQGIPFYGLRQRALNWQSTGAYAGFRVMHVGHFHSFGRMCHNRLTIMLNGTMVSDDEWALHELGYESDQLWHFHGISDRRPITWDFALEAGDEPGWEAIAA